MRAVLLGLALVGVIAAAGCADGTGSRATAVTIAVAPDAGIQPHVWSLQCDPPAGDHPDPWGACDFLAEQEAAGTDPFAPVPHGVLCTQQYQGPALAAVDGTWEGRPVAASFRLTDGCEIARWEAAKPLLGTPPSLA